MSANDWDVEFGSNQVKEYLGGSGPDSSAGYNQGEEREEKETLRIARSD